MILNLLPQVCSIKHSISHVRLISEVCLLYHSLYFSCATHVTQCQFSHLAVLCWFGLMVAWKWHAFCLGWFAGHEFAEWCLVASCCVLNTTNHPVNTRHVFNSMDSDLNALSSSFRKRYVSHCSPCHDENEVGVGVSLVFYTCPLSTHDINTHE